MGAPSLLGLAAGLLLLAVIFRLIERRGPAAVSQRSAADTRTDLLYWFFTPLVTRVGTRLALGIAFGAIALWQGVSLSDLRAAAASRRQEPR